MAIFSLDCELVQRSKGHSAVEVAARCSATRLYDQRLDRFFNYHQKKPVVFSQVLLPEGVPAAWQAVFVNGVVASSFSEVVPFGC